MPYIDASDRKRYVDLINSLAELIPKDKSARPGHMNFAISFLIKQVYGSSMRYADHNEVIGVLECAKNEFYRRSTAPYEDKKIQEQGDL